MTTYTLDKKNDTSIQRMNHTQEDHRIRVYKSHSTRDSFTGLWTSIAKQHHFLRLQLSSSSSSLSSSSTPSRQEIDQAIRAQNGQMSPYSSQVLEKYQVIYQKGDIVIVTNDPPTSTLGTFFAVEDTDCPHRYFIAFSFPVGGMMENITGLLVYFHKNGTCYSDRTVICENVLVSYDVRNGLLRAQQTFLYHQSLVFTQIHRDTKKLLLFLNYIPYHSDVVEDHTSYYTSYIVRTPLTTFGEGIALFKRYLRIPLEADATLFLDLGSMDRVEEKHLYEPFVPDVSAIPYQTHCHLLLTSYQVSKKEHIMGFLDSAQLFPEKEYSDGYPLRCRRCDSPVVTASYGYKYNTANWIQIGLGSGYCPTCRIRYSLTKREWVCSAIHLNGSICDGYFIEECCRHQSLHSQDQTVIELQESILPKHPYRRKIRIQWIPSEEARRCAETASRMSIGADFYVSDTPPLKVEDLV
jgi:hypothetical protein